MSTDPTPAQPLGAVLLAAGAASRYGSPKQLAELHGVPLVRRAAQAILDCGAALLVVTGAQAERVAGALHGLPLRLAHNPLWELGMGESIACGFRTLLGQTPAPPASLLCLVDQPLVGAEQLQRLIDQYQADFQADTRRIIVSDHGQSVGPPCLFPAACYTELAQLSGPGGARQILQRHREAVITVKMPEAAHDIDTPEDRLRALQALPGVSGRAGSLKRKSTDAL